MAALLQPEFFVLLGIDLFLAISPLSCLLDKHLPWQLQLIKYDDNNINRLTNCTIWLNNASTPSTQIEIIDGEYTQVSGDYYNPLGNGADNITLTVSTNMTGNT